MADRELDDLAKYLLHVASIDDMETLNHKVVLQSHGDIIVEFHRPTRIGSELSVNCLPIDC